MKSIWNALGIIIFWILWPVWFVYFMFMPLRSRVLVVCEDEVLLVKGWIGRGKWSLPGGGKSERESIEACAVRELKEEVGIDVAESALRDLGRFEHNDVGLHFIGRYFVLELDETAKIKKRWPEISEARWFKMSEIRGRMLDKDAAYALKKYMPMHQITLL